MDFLVHIDMISMKLSMSHFKGLSVKISINDAFLSLKIVFNLANSADPGELLPYVTGLDKQKIQHKIVNIFLPIMFSMFWVLKRTVSLRRFF